MKIFYQFLRLIAAIVFFPITIFRILTASFSFILALFGGKSQGTSALSGIFLFIVVGAFSGFAYWAYVAEIETSITGQARLVPSKKLQTVEHFGGGILKEILIEVGDRVTKGEILIKLDPLEDEANYESLKSEFVETLIKVQRLNSEYNDNEPEFSKEMEDLAPSQIRNQLLLKQARRASFQASMASFEAQLRQKSSELIGQERTLALIEEERLVILQLVAKGLEPKLEAVRAEKTFAEATARVAAIKSSIDEINDRKSIAIEEYKAQILQELADANLKLSQIERQLSVSANRTDRTVIRSPIDGTVNRVLVSTIGSVVSGGEAIVEIVPEDNELLFEAKIMTADIAYVVPGQRALLKLSAYDFALFGFLEGEVTIVGSDSIAEDGAGTYFPVKIRPNSQVSSTGRKLALMPGMESQIDIITGKRTIASYITSPITRTLSEALTEN